MVWGYRDRPDPSGPELPGGGIGGVEEPRKDWPRGVAQAVKSADKVSRAIFYVLNSFRSMIFGSTAVTLNFLAAAGAGSSSSQVGSGWLSALKRQGYLMSESMNGSSFSRRFERVIWTPSILPWLDPDRGELPATLRLEDECGGLTTTTTANTMSAIGMGHSDQGVLAGLAGGTWPWYPWIGFQAQWQHPATSAAWRCYFIDEAGTQHVALTTAYDTSAPHHLAVELDGKLHQIRWYIDGALVASHDVVAGEAWPDNAAGESETVWGIAVWSASGNINSTVQFLIMADYQTLLSVSLQDVA